jgi:hypothetical protein
MIISFIAGTVWPDATDSFFFADCLHDCPVKKVSRIKKGSKIDKVLIFISYLDVTSIASSSSSDLPLVSGTNIKANTKPAAPNTP